MLKTDEKAGEGDLGHELDELNLMLDASVDCIKVIDSNGMLLKMNRSGCEALGVAASEAPYGIKWLSLLPPDIRIRGRRALRVARQGRKASFSGRSELPGHKTIHWDNILTPVTDENGQVSSILCVSRNITRQREAEKKLRFASDFDALTQLPNRRYLRRHMSRCLQALTRTGKPLGFLIIDVDYFKEVNDLHGHEAGDLLLRTISQRFSALRAPDEFIARLGGDEFAVVASGIKDAGQLAAVAERLRGALRQPIRYKGRKLSIGLSIGGAVSAPGRLEISSLMHAGDLALYKVKAGGRNGYRLFDEEAETTPTVVPELLGA